MAKRTKRRRVVSTADYKFKSTPRPYQQVVFEQSRDREWYAIFLEQGLGKTKIALDTAAWLYDTGEINALVVTAPNGVHREWATDQIPEHLPDRVRACSLIWRSGRVGGKAYTKELNDLIGHEGLAVFLINVEAVITKAGKAYLKKFLLARRTLMVIDESTTIKNPGASRTKLLSAARKYADYRRIMSGTPTPQGPFDYYSQFRFLSPSILGFDSFYVFKHHFGSFERKFAGGSTGHQYDSLTEYRNLSELRDMIADHSVRLTKKDCAVDLPPKIYKKRYYPLPSDQRKIYNRLRDEFLIELSGGSVGIPMVLTRITRLQQITCGFLPADFDDPDAGWEDVGDKQPRIEMAMEAILDSPGKTIVWCRFRHDVDALCEAFSQADVAAVRYDGAVPQNKRPAALKAFREGKARVFVGNPHAGGRGLNLQVADTVVYFSNDFSLEARLQSEDRAHRLGQKNTVVYIDLIAENTVDEKIVTALRDKKSMADLLTGDDPEEWL